MKLRLAIASTYTLFVAAFLLSWPVWRGPWTNDQATVITATESARWLMIFTPFFWAWFAWDLRPKWACAAGLAASVALLVGCFALIWYHDNILDYVPCLWAGGCGTWFD